MFYKFMIQYHKQIVGINMNQNFEDIMVTIEKITMYLYKLLREDFIGLYVHGSLVLGGFNGEKSDIDLIVIIEKELSLEQKVNLTQFFLRVSSNPYPIEISFLTKLNLCQWRHPFPYSFHYSEYWREAYSNEIENDQFKHLSNINLVDYDLAAHITVLHYKGVCLYGPKINSIFPEIPKIDYKDSLKREFTDCLELIESKPVNSILNLLRIFFYLKNELILSKSEAGVQGLTYLPDQFSGTIKSINTAHLKGSNLTPLNLKGLIALKNYLSDEIRNLV